MTEAAPAIQRPDFSRAPFIVIWEVTRACALACQHCRAEAQPERDPGELTTAEGLALLTRLREGFGEVLLVLTGGDPLARTDLHELIRHGTAIGLRMAITPSATPLLTSQAIGALRDAGIKRMALSLDGADAPTHDAFRGVPDTFRRTIEAFTTARNLGVELQVNTSVGRHNLDQLEQIAKLVGWIDARLWSVFMLVPTGRAGEDLLLDAVGHERVYRALARIALDPATAYDIKTTAGQPYYRVLAQERRRRAGTGAAVVGHNGRAPRGVNDGNGFLFVSHTGELCPSGFLPIAAGNVRADDPIAVYRDHPLFTRLRQPETFAGKCGVCDFNQVCGGSRSRAYGLTGDPFASDPTCVYVPAGSIGAAADK